MALSFPAFAVEDEQLIDTSMSRLLAQLEVSTVACMFSLTRIWCLHLEGIYVNALQLPFDVYCTVWGIGPPYGKASPPISYPTSCKGCLFRGGGGGGKRPTCTFSLSSRSVWSQTGGSPVFRPFKTLSQTYATSMLMLCVCSLWSVSRADMDWSVFCETGTRQQQRYFLI